MTPAAAVEKVVPTAIRESAEKGADTEDVVREERPNVYRSWLLTRLLVGIVGVSLIVVTLGGDLLGDAIDPERPFGLRGSLSAYYYAGFLGDWFVGSLWAIGVGLMAYMGTRKSSFANRISWGAGSAAIVVALFPTNNGGTPATWVSLLHFGAAAAVIIGLGVLCVGFGIYDKRRRDSDPGIEARRWIHYGAAIVIFVMVGFAALNAWLDIWPSHGTLAAEALAVFAFAVSWFAKGWEIFEYSRRRPVDRYGRPRDPAPSGPENAGADAELAEVRS